MAISTNPERVISHMMMITKCRKVMTAVDKTRHARLRPALRLKVRSEAGRRGANNNEHMLLCLMAAAGEQTNQLLLSLLLLSGGFVAMIQPPGNGQRIEPHQAHLGNPADWLLAAQTAGTGLARMTTPYSGQTGSLCQHHCRIE